MISNPFHAEKKCARDNLELAIDRFLHYFTIQELQALVDVWIVEREPARPDLRDPVADEVEREPRR